MENAFIIGGGNISNMTTEDLINHFSEVKIEYDNKGIQRIKDNGPEEDEMLVEAMEEEIDNTINITVEEVLGVLEEDVDI
jgi:hypothetical protein